MKSRGIRAIILSFTISLWGAFAALADTAPAVPAAATDAGAAAGAPAAAAGQPNFLMSVAPFAMMFGVIYFLMIRPQQKRMKEQQEMIGALKDGDEVLTASGILGKITGIAEKVVTLEIAQNVRIKILKTQVSQVIKGQIKDLA